MTFNYDKFLDDEHARHEKEHEMPNCHLCGDDGEYMYDDLSALERILFYEMITEQAICDYCLEKEKEAQNAKS